MRSSTNHISFSKWGIPLHCKGQWAKSFRHPNLWRLCITNNYKIHNLYFSYCFNDLSCTLVQVHNLIVIESGNCVHFLSPKLKVNTPFPELPTPTNITVVEFKTEVQYFEPSKKIWCNLGLWSQRVWCFWIGAWD